MIGFDDSKLIRKLEVVRVNGRQLTEMLLNSTAFDLHERPINLVCVEYKGQQNRCLIPSADVRFTCS